MPKSSNTATAAKIQSAMPRRYIDSSPEVEKAPASGASATYGSFCNKESVDRAVAR